MGDDKGTCPVCHSGLLVVGKTTVECAICGIHGTLKADNGRIDVTFLPEEAKARLQKEGKRIHGREIQAVTEEYFSVKTRFRHDEEVSLTDIKIADQPSSGRPQLGLSRQ